MKSEQRAENIARYLNVSKFLFVFFVWFVVNINFSFAQEKQQDDLFISLFAETNGYGWDTMSYGGGAQIGFGTGGALGLRFLYAFDNEQVSYLEINVFARLYFFGKDSFSGPFIQLNAGPVIYTDTYQTPDRPGYGNITAGISAGWRFMFGKHFFAEPALRIGYPYLAGFSIAFGYR